MNVPQSRLYQFQPLGVIGELFDDSPRTLVEGYLNSTDQANNVVGRVFTYVTTTPATSYVIGVKAGGADNYAGILINAKQYALYGTQGNPLAPSLTLPNSLNVCLLKQGRIIVSLPINSVAATNNPFPNDQVIYNTTTGELDSIKPGASIPAGYASAKASVVLIDPNVPAGYVPTQTSVLAVIDVNYNPYP